MPDDMVIQRGIPHEHAQRAATIYYAAFQRKLTPILGQPAQATAILRESMQANCAFIAMRDEQLLGLVGFHHAGQHLVDVRFNTLVTTFGWLSGSWRTFLGALLARTPQPGELLLDGIAVHPDARRQGVGTRLFDAIFAFAGEQGYTHVRLDVVNSNPRARHLYERIGFAPLKTVFAPFMRSWGFTAVTTMIYSIEKSSQS